MSGKHVAAAIRHVTLTFQDSIRSKMLRKILTEQETMKKHVILSWTCEPRQFHVITENHSNTMTLSQLHDKTEGMKTSWSVSKGFGVIFNSNSNY